MNVSSSAATHGVTLVCGGEAKQSCFSSRSWRVRHTPPGEEGQLARVLAVVKCSVSVGELESCTAHSDIKCFQNLPTTQSPRQGFAPGIRKCDAF